MFLNAPIFKLKYSKYHPNILSACGEDGYLSIIDVNSNYLRSESNISRGGNYYNNVDSENEISPLYYNDIHDNAIYGLNWCDNDTKIFTSSADTLSKITNISQDKLGVCELELIGHTKRIKSNAQNIFNENILATCGGDGIIFIWDKRDFNKRYCNSQCPNYKNNNSHSHIHPIGAFRNVYKDLVLKKKYSPNIGLLNCEVHNTFTEVDFYDSNLIVSTETNNDDLKFWEMRNMLTNELEYFFCNEKKITKKELIKKLDAKNYLSSISPYSHLYIKYNNYKQKNRLSSKFNSNENSLFPSIYFFTTSSTSTNKRRAKDDTKNKNINNKNYLINNKNQTLLDEYLEKMKNNFETQMIIDKDLNHENISNSNNNSFQTNQSNILDSSSLSNNYSTNSTLDGYNSEMETYYREKIKESRNKQGIKGLTSLNINRDKGSILINSISGYQYVYDYLFLDEKEPIELKLSSSSLFVKSVLSTSGRYVLSGSKGPELIIWDLYKKNNEGNTKKIHFTDVHKRDVNAVDWGRNINNFIASGCDGGLIAIWDVNNQ